MRLDGATFIVTGGASGLGAASARMILEAGGNAVLADTNPRTEEFAGRIPGAATLGLVADITLEADAQAVVEAALKTGARQGSCRLGHAANC